MLDATLSLPTPLVWIATQSPMIVGAVGGRGPPSSPWPPRSRPFVSFFADRIPEAAHHAAVQGHVHRDPPLEHGDAVRRGRRLGQRDVMRVLPASPGGPRRGASWVASGPAITPVMMAIVPCSVEPVGRVWHFMMSVRSGRDGEVLEVRRRHRGVARRVACCASGPAPYPASSSDDLVRPGEGDRAVVEDVQVGVADPAAGGVGVLEVGAPDLLAGGRVGLGDIRSGRHRPLGRREVPAHEEQLAGLRLLM